MNAMTQRSLHGWRLFLLFAVILVALALAAFATVPDAAEGTRAAIRVTARTSFLLFLAAFTASSFAILLPMPATQWLLRERRVIGLSFAFSHLLHAIAITTFGVLNPAFWPARSALGNLPGSMGYAAILILAITSHRGVARRMGPTAWRRVHLAGMWIIAAVFTYSYFKRVPANFWYAVPSAMLFTAFVVRWIAKSAQKLRRQQRTNHPPAPAHPAR